MDISLRTKILDPSKFHVCLGRRPNKCVLREIKKTFPGIFPTIVMLTIKKLPLTKTTNDFDRQTVNNILQKQLLGTKLHILGLRKQ